jgi:uncharacterized protein YjbI with pentapeptide repeats
MANQHHLDLLQQGVQAWNQWRKEHHEILPDFFLSNLQGANLPGVYFNGAFCDRVNLSGANLSRAVFAAARLIQSNLRQADLKGAYLGRADLSGAALHGVDLSEANLFGANLSGATLTGAYLSQTNLTRTNLRDANLSGVRLGLTVLGDVDLRSVQGLEEIVHHCKSYLSLETITRSGRDLPVVFLQGIGFSDQVITAIRSSGTISLDDPASFLSEDRTCFISYAQEDLAFAQQLHADLQRHGVRCWLDREDQLDDQLRFSTRHVLVLSEHSVILDWEDSEKRDWVFQQVIDALATEQEQEHQVVVPVRLDETILQSNDDWAKRLYQTRYIEDFTQWKNATDYQQAFERLLGDLQETGAHEW